MKDSAVVFIVGIICIALMEMMAIYRGMDGALLSTVVAAISTIVSLAVGYEVGKKRQAESTSS